MDARGVRRRRRKAHVRAMTGKRSGPAGSDGQRTKRSAAVSSPGTSASGHQRSGESFAKAGATAVAVR